MSKYLSVSFGPHIKDPMSVKSMTYTTIAALIPALLVGFYFFGLRAVVIVILSVGAALGTEAGMQRLKKEPVDVEDGTAALIGLLLAMLLPVGTPWWTVIVGAFVAIFLGRVLFGGLGGNAFNAVLVGFLVLQLSWPEAVNTFYNPPTILSGWGPMFELHNSELPLGILQYGDSGGIGAFYGFGAALVGGIPGGIGSTSVIALAAGGIYLIVKKILPWQVPVGFLAGLFFFAAICWLTDSEGIKYANPFYHIIFGYTIIGAFFLAPDPTTSPYTGLGAILYGIGAGVLTMIIRYWGAYQEGVIFAIFFFNALTPMLDRIPFKSYGLVKSAK